MFGSFSKLPGGNVHPSRIVKLQSDNTVVEAGVGDDPWGISQPYTWRMALTGWDDGFAGIVGIPPINIFGPGDDQCKLELGGTVSIGDPIAAGANGVGVKATADGDKVAAIAQAAGVSGDVILVKPLRYEKGS